MIQGTKRVHINVDDILSKISSYDIFRFYMPDKSWKLNKVTLSPFRNEKNPSFVIGNKKGNLSFIDFSDTNLRGDCFDFVKCLFHVNSFQDVLLMIDRDFGLGIANNTNVGEYKKIVSSYKQPENIRQYSLIQVITRKFTKEELAYWAQYHQDVEDLRKNNIFGIKTVYLNKSKFGMLDTEIRFGYLYEGQYWKIYRPFADKKYKWVPNNVPITTMDGLEDIKHCRMAFINKSKKDYMVVKKVFPCSCAVQNEGIACFSPENVDYLKANSDIQILSFDSDVTGVNNSQQITKLFDFGYANVPRKYLAEGIKDWADLAKAHGLETVRECLTKKGLYDY